MRKIMLKSFLEVKNINFHNPTNVIDPEGVTIHE